MQCYLTQKMIITKTTNSCDDNQCVTNYYYTHLLLCVYQNEVFLLQSLKSKNFILFKNSIDTVTNLILAKWKIKLRKKISECTSTN